MNHTITKEQVLNAYSNAPNVVRAVFNDDKTTQIVIGLQTKFQLHIDTAGVLGKGVGYMLLGLVNPQEFLNELIAAKIPDKDAREIMTEINQKIFVPLREEMRKGPPAEVKPPQVQSVAPSSAPRESVLQSRTTMISANPQLPQRSAQTLASVPRYVPPKKYFNLQNKIPPAPPKATQVTVPPTTTTIPSAGSLTSINPVKLLEDHEEPHIEFSKTPMPAKTAPPPPNLPGVIQPAPIPEPPRASPEATQGVAPPTKPIVPVAPVIPVAPYSSDPYREPIEP